MYSTLVKNELMVLIGDFSIPVSVTTRIGSTFSLCGQCHNVRTLNQQTWVVLGILLLQLDPYF